MKRLLAILPFILLAACATDTGDPAKDRRGRVTNAIGQEIFNAVLNFGLSEGRSYLTGQNGQDAAQAAFTAAQGLVSTDSIARIVKAYAGPEVAAVAQAQFAKAAPVTPEDKALVANIIGAGLQQAANQLAK